MQTNCLGFSFLRLGSRYAAVHRSDGCSFSATLMFLQLNTLVFIGMPQFSLSYYVQFLTTGFHRASSFRKLCVKQKDEEICSSSPTVLLPTHDSKHHECESFVRCKQQQLPIHKIIIFPWLVVKSVTGLELGMCFLMGTNNLKNR